MAGNLSTAAATLLATWLDTDETAVRPTQWFLALYSSAPTNAGGGVELTQDGYERQEILFDATGGANTNELTFGPALEDWPEITHGAIFDENDRFITWKPLPTPRTIPDGTELKFLAGSITMVFS